MPLWEACNPPWEVQAPALSLRIRGELLRATLAAIKLRTVELPARAVSQAARLQLEA